MKRTTTLAPLISAALAAPALAGSDRLFAFDTFGSELHEVNPTTGATISEIPVRNAAGTLITAINGLTYDAATDTMWAFRNPFDEVYTLDYNTGVATLVGVASGPGGVSNQIQPRSIEIDDSGTLYAWSSNLSEDNFLTIDPATGLASGVANNGILSVGGLGWDSDNGVMHHFDTEADRLVVIDRVSGAVTPVGPFGVSNLGSGVAYSSQYGMLATTNPSNNNRLYSVNLSTGAATQIGLMGTGSVTALAFVPEPASLVLLVMAASMRRRN